jgi:hypothetical protein
VPKNNAPVNPQEQEEAVANLLDLEDQVDHILKVGTGILAPHPSPSHPSQPLYSETCKDEDTLGTRVSIHYYKSQETLLSTWLSFCHSTIVSLNYSGALKPELFILSIYLWTMLLVKASTFRFHWITLSKTCWGKNDEAAEL